MKLHSSCRQTRLSRATASNLQIPCFFQYASELGRSQGDADGHGYTLNAGHVLNDNVKYIGITSKRSERDGGTAGSSYSRLQLSKPR